MEYVFWYYVFGTFTYVYAMDMWFRVQVSRKKKHRYIDTYSLWLGFIIHVTFWPITTVLLTIQYFKIMTEEGGVVPPTRGDRK